MRLNALYLSAPLFLPPTGPDMAYRPRDRIVTYAAPSAQVVTLLDMKDHLRVDNDDDDALIIGYIASAVAAVERWTQRLLTPRQAVLQLPGLPSGKAAVELPGGEVSAVSSVVVDGVTITGAAAYGHSPAVLIPANDWPSVSGDGYPVTITYTAGFSVVPHDLIVAVQLICGAIYEVRGDATAVAQHPTLVNSQLFMRPYRIMPA